MKRHKCNSYCMKRHQCNKLHCTKWHEHENSFTARLGISTRNPSLFFHFVSHLIYIRVSIFPNKSGFASPFSLNLDVSSLKLADGRDETSDVKLTPNRFVLRELSCFLTSRRVGYFRLGVRDVRHDVVMALHCR